MDVYCYQAALLCEECGSEVRRSLISAGHAPADPDDEHTYDSDDFPKGPYSDGGGEADCPQHCDKCFAFLENPLTKDGFEYVVAALARHCLTGRGNAEVLQQWAKFYDIEPRRAADELPERDFYEGDSPDY